jgi:opacity protein-like surface antigen
MKTLLKAGMASSVLALALTVTASDAFAADLGGSIKDGYSAAPSYAAPAAGPCYFRGDVGYSISQDPSVKWPVNNITREFLDQGSHDDYYAGVPGAAPLNETTTFAGDNVTNVSMENTWLAEGGIGCGSGSRGFRSEIMLGYRGDRKLDGMPNDFSITDVITGVPEAPNDIEDPLHTNIQTYTLMLNVYHDFGNFNRFVPYVGAGIGMAVHDVDEVYFTGNEFLTNRIEGNRDVSFAWSVMAGVGYQISDRAILDVGYRYIDMGSVTSGRVDNAGFVNPAVQIDDIAAHEIKVGLRYHFGGSDAGYAPFK